MMTEELHLEPVDTTAVLRTSMIVGFTCLVGSFLPLVPYFLVAKEVAVGTSIALAAAILFGVGVYTAKSFAGDWRKSGVQMLVIGLGAAGVGFLIGLAFPASHGA